MSDFFRTPSIAMAELNYQLFSLAATVSGLIMKRHCTEDAGYYCCLL